MVKNDAAAPCDKDCFHCKFPDCIWDGHDRESQRTYREANKEKIAAQGRAYREANKERIAAQRRAYREAKKKGG